MRLNSLLFKTIRAMLDVYASVYGRSASYELTRDLAPRYRPTFARPIVIARYGDAIDATAYLNAMDRASMLPTQVGNTLALAGVTLRVRHTKVGV